MRGKKVQISSTEAQTMTPELIDPRHSSMSQHRVKSMTATHPVLREEAKGVSDPSKEVDEGEKGGKIIEKQIILQNNGHVNSRQIVNNKENPKNNTTNMELSFNSNNSKSVIETANDDIRLKVG